MAEKNVEGKAAKSGGGLVDILAAKYKDYSQNFSDYYFLAGQVQHSVENIKRYFRRDNLTWGAYQKYAPDDPADPNNWRDTSLYDYWESAISEARAALEKLPAPNRGPDPDNPGRTAANMLEHLDEVVRIALFDKYQYQVPGGSGIEIVVKVPPRTRPTRRHEVETRWEADTAWRPDPNDPLSDQRKWKRLRITMHCPLGGWIGETHWKYGGSAPITKFSAKYRVPQAPTAGSQIIFIFNGLESLPDKNRTDQPGILQPVLQWTPAGGWAVRSWYVPANYTPTIDQMPPLNSKQDFVDLNSPAWTVATSVAENALLDAIISLNGTSYQAQFAGIANSSLTTPGILPLTLPVGVIEAYSFTNAAELVSSVTMTDIKLEVAGVAVRPRWEIGDENGPGDDIHSGNTKLQWYRVRPQAKGSKLNFTRKN